MVLCQIPTISPSNPGGGGVGDAIDRCITLYYTCNYLNVQLLADLTSISEVEATIGSEIKVP